MPCSREDIIDITHDGPWATMGICTNQHLVVNAPVRSAVIEDPQKLLPDDADPPYELAMMNPRREWQDARSRIADGKVNVDGTSM